MYAYNSIHVPSNATQSQNLDQKKAQLFQWCVDGKCKEIRNFVEDNLERKNMLLEPNKHGVYCVHQAAGFGRLNILELLVEEYGADVNVVDENRWKPLHYAVRRKYTSQQKATVKMRDICQTKKLSEANNDLALFVTSDKFSRLVEEGVRKRSIAGLADLAEDSNEDDSSEESMDHSPDKGIIDNMKNRSFKFHPPVKYLMQKMSESDVHEDTLKQDFVNVLQHAIVHNNFEAVLEMIKHFSEHSTSDTSLSEMLNLQYESDNKWTTLHTAASHGFDEIVKVLLYYGADMGLLDERKWTPFHYAVAEGNSDAIRTFVSYAREKQDKYAVIDGLTDSPHTPMQLAIINGHISIVDYLLDEKVSLTTVENTSDTCLHLACKSNDVKLFDLIFEKDKSDLDKCNRLGQSPLHYAAIHDCDKVARRLIENEANLELYDYNKRTPLFLAVEHNSKKTLNVLLEKGVSFRIVDRSLKTCVFIAVEKDSLEALKILLTHIGDDFSILANKGDDRNRTPLHVAAEKGCIEAVNILLESAKADVFARDYQEETALHLAAQNGHKEVVKTLLGNTPRLLDQLDNKWDSALHKAAQAGQSSVVEFLLLTKTKFTKRNKSKKSALDLAALHGHLDVVRILVRETKSRYDTIRIKEILVSPTNECLNSCSYRVNL
ncbi:hypothetical protein Ciccas_008460 [Cichlidogyrus casuarinus]|uniref:Uncharacterized protein n=1 Tax=Cichlidogyrus casuarinus TaxID=1844966 RepID=A0ABD2Q2I9_9PLAT